jgi:hypothetical protein
MIFRTQLIDLGVFFNYGDLEKQRFLRRSKIGWKFLSQVSYSGVETKDTNTEFKILKLEVRGLALHPLVIYSLDSDHRMGPK